MASLSLSLSLTSSRLPLLHYRSPPFASLSLSSPPHSLRLIKPTSSTRLLKNLKPTSAYVPGPASDYAATDPKPTVEESRSENFQSVDAVNWGLLWTLLLEHKWRLALCASALVGCTSCTLCMPLFSGRFFEVLSGARNEPMWKLMSSIAVLYALEPVFTMIFVINMNKIWERVMAVLRAQIFRRMLIQKVEFFDRYKVGELTGLLTSDFGSVQNVVTENVSRDRGFRALSEVVGTICILFALSPQLAPVLGLLMLIVSISVAVYKRSTMPVFKAHGFAQSFMSDCVSETISAIRTVRSFCGEKRQMSAFGRQVLAYEGSGIKLGTFKSINESLTRVAVYVSLLALYWLGGNKVKAGELSIGTVVSFIGYTFTLTFAVQGLVYTFGDLRGCLAAVERINSILSGSEIDQSLAYGLERQIQPKDVQDEKFKLFVVNGYDEKQSKLVRYMSDLGSSSDVYSLAWSGDICLEDVHFSYPLRPDVEVLGGLNLTLKSGTVTALVGPSGAGKSTVVQLLARFYEPTIGRITVAGEDIRTFDKSEWARVVSIVNQDPVLFSVSVAENIAYGRPDADVSKGDIIKAAKAANAHEFIISLPQGYDTQVGERGGLLSGGQRQRIAIARALLKNTPILILDEATSALDTVSERLVQEALDHLMNGRTTLVIAHRLSTVQNAHQIALCSDGRITELGTHSELLSRNGEYASLVGTQRLAFE